MQTAPKASFAYAVEATGDQQGRTMRIPVIIEDESAAAPQHRGVFVGSLMSFLAVSGAAVTFPFAQARRDALGCDALCVGGQTSLRSGLTLAGAALIGRASDRFGRLPMLWLGLAASCASLAINAGTTTITGMWVALVPAALLNQNFSVLKALFSDYTAEAGGTDADRAGAVGRLGMAVGLSFMAGPILATLLVADYEHALLLSAALTFASGVSLCRLPSPARAGPPPVAAGATTTGGLMDFVRLPVLRTPGAQLLMAMRLLMALAFHMFMPVWQVSLKTRFSFGPKDHAMFMGLVGLSYALSQGVVAKPLIRRAGSNPSVLILACIVMLGGGRPIALTTSSLGVVYALYAGMVVALGVMNTAITTACSGLAAADQLGGLFGVMESVESIAGMVGPTIGGLAAARGQVTPLVAVCGCYAAAFVLVVLFFKKHVSDVAHAAETKKTEVELDTVPAAWTATKAKAE